MIEPRAVKTLILGLGNPLLGDDGVGWRVAEQISNLISASRLASDPRKSIEVDFHAGGGMSLMERLVGYDRTILIDAMNLGKSDPGTVTSFPLEELVDPFAGHLASTHETSLRTALEAGRTMGVLLPSQIFVVAIESPYVYDVSETLSPPVSDALPRAVELVLKRLEE